MNIISPKEFISKKFKKTQIKTKIEIIENYLKSIWGQWAFRGLSKNITKIWICAHMSNFLTHF